MHDILERFGMKGSSSFSTLIPQNHNLGLGTESDEDVDLTLYRAMIGSLMYLTASRPDIMFVVCLCA